MYVGLHGRNFVHGDKQLIDIEIHKLHRDDEAECDKYHNRESWFGECSLRFEVLCSLHFIRGYCISFVHCYPLVLYIF